MSNDPRKYRSVQIEMPTEVLYYIWLVVINVMPNISSFNIFCTLALVSLIKGLARKCSIKNWGEENIFKISLSYVGYRVKMNLIIHHLLKSLLIIAYTIWQPDFIFMSV